MAVTVGANHQVVAHSEVIKTRAAAVKNIIAQAKAFFPTDGMWFTFQDDTPAKPVVYIVDSVLGAKPKVQKWPNAVPAPKYIAGKNPKKK